MFRRLSSFHLFYWHPRNPSVSLAQSYPSLFVDAWHHCCTTSTSRMLSSPEDLGLLKLLSWLELILETSKKINLALVVIIFIFTNWHNGFQHWSSRLIHFRQLLPLLYSSASPTLVFTSSSTSSYFFLSSRPSNSVIFVYYHSVFWNDWQSVALKFIEFRINGMFNETKPLMLTIQSKLEVFKQLGIYHSFYCHFPNFQLEYNSTEPHG